MANAKQPSDELDSVDVEFGKEYSEETLAILRGVDRPTYLQESSSLDPAEDVGMYVEGGLNLPPAAFDSLQARGRAEMAALQAAADYQPGEGERDQVRYRQRLTQGAAPEDLTWLKLRAYHRALGRLGSTTAAAPGDGTPGTVADGDHQQQLLDQYDVPRDIVRPDLLALATPQQLAERRKLAAIAAVRAARAAAARKTVSQRILNAPEPSTDSAWDDTGAQQQPAAGGPRARLLQGVRAALAAHPAFLQLLPGAAQSTSQEAVSPPSPELEAPQPETAPVVQPPVYRTLYTTAYKDQLELKARLQRQSQVQHAVFWGSFLTATGLFVFRALRRRMLRRRKTSSGGAQQAARIKSATTERRTSQAV